jgi:hypothetical protein
MSSLANDYGHGTIGGKIVQFGSPTDSIFPYTQVVVFDGGY